MLTITSLKCIAEVEQCGSISSAARNLYMSQPNLSNTLKAVEKEIGYPIFERSKNGVIPTEQGTHLLTKVRQLLQQYQEIENLCVADRPDEIKLGLSVTRATYITAAYCAFLSQCNSEKKIALRYRETNSHQVLLDLMNKSYQMGVIRYNIRDEEYYRSAIKSAKLLSEPIFQFRTRILVSKNSPLIEKEVVTEEDLNHGIELMHDDTCIPDAQYSNLKETYQNFFSKNHIYAYERGSEYQILSKVPNTYMWVAPVPEDMLELYGLVTIDCPKLSEFMTDALIYPAGHKMNEQEKIFVEELKKITDALKPSVQV